MVGMIQTLNDMVREREDRIEKVISHSSRLSSTRAFAGKRVVILGLARQGIVLARFFAANGAQVVVSDAAPADSLQAERAALAGLPIEFILGEHPFSLLDGCDLLCLSGGVPPQLPIVQEALQRAIPLSNDSLLTSQSARQLGLGPLVAITGSSGKTTTTTLAGQMLIASGKYAHVGGNIGTPLLDRLDAIDPDEPLLLELSSFQLELFDPSLAYGQVEGAGPDIGALLNITPNHLDRHPDMAAYAAAKLNMLQQMPAGATLVVSVDDPVTARLAGVEYHEAAGPLPAEWHLTHLLAQARASITARRITVLPFSRQRRLATGAWLEDDYLIYQGHPICRRDALLLRGEHNISNMLAAMAISGAAGATINAMSEIAQSFAGVAHRLEVISQKDGVTWINDSIATSPERAIAGLRSFEKGQQTLILLAGGKDKNLPWDSFATEVLAKVSFLIGFGQSGPMIVRLVQERARFGQQKAPNCAVVQRLDEAVELAARIASPNSVVLLSPGGTSYDAYKNFEERGEHFRHLVDKGIEVRNSNGHHSAGQ
jgi:UDP-N-acetylmuramoylalanine--D-glutamate ligase